VCAHFLFLWTPSFVMNNWSMFQLFCGYWTFKIVTLFPFYGNRTHNHIFKKCLICNRRYIHQRWVWWCHNYPTPMDFSFHTLGKKNLLSRVAFYLLVLGNINVNFAWHWLVLPIYIGTPQTFHSNRDKFQFCAFYGAKILPPPSSSLSPPRPLHPLAPSWWSPSPSWWSESIERPIVLSFMATLVIDIVLQSVLFFLMF
jgi:hypothetical protein